MYLEKFNLKDQVAVVTGGARNIGLESATALGEAGAHVVITDIDELAGHAALAKLSSKRIDASYYNMDVTNSSQVNAVADQIEARWGRIDILVANAGICYNTAAEDIEDDEWLRVMNVNLNGVFYCDRAFGKKMLNNPRGGKIINIGSISGLIAAKPQPQCHYDASKAAVHMLTKSLAAHWSSRGVRVNAIAPSYIESDITQKGMANSAWYDTWMEMTPTHRMGKPQEVASVVLFLASELSSLMHGSIVVADSAYTCW